MKTREQLEEEIIKELGYGGDLTFETIPEIIDKVVSACEEAIDPQNNEKVMTAYLRIAGNLKKLKSK
jgi:hypothetical protein